MIACHLLRRNILYLTLKMFPFKITLIPNSSIPNARNTRLFPSKSKNVHRSRLWHNKKLAGLRLDNDIGVPQLPHELLSNGGPSGGLVSWVLDSSAGWKPFLGRLCLRQSSKTNWDRPGSKVCRQRIQEKRLNLLLVNGELGRPKLDYNWRHHS